jgi:hypothetical protein
MNFIPVTLNLLGVAIIGVCLLQNLVFTLSNSLSQLYMLIRAVGA